MRGRRMMGRGLLRGLAPATALLPFLLCSCGPAESKPGPQQTTSTTSTTTSTTTTSAGGGGAGGGSGGTSSVGGSGGSSSGGGGASLCGNGVLDPGESCDGALLGGASCQGQGYPGGTLACGPECGFDISQCTGADACTDGLDNDGDQLIDCEEADCVAACADPCLAPVLLQDPARVTGSSIAHAGTLKSSCVAASGPEIVYAVSAANTGVLDIVLVEQDTTGFSLSVRTSCAADGSELACSNLYAPGQATAKQLSLPVTAGQMLFVVVDGDGATAEGSYSLGVQSHPVVCGDSLQDPPEGCDDGNTTGNDGCSATCVVESAEQDPNGTLATANHFMAPWFAQISPLGDVDYVKVTLPATATLSATATGVGEGTCTDGSLDSYLTLFNAAGTALAVNDDAGPGDLCARVTAPNLAPGDYYLRIQASGPFPVDGATFPYQLLVETFTCGDGNPSVGEECDDGNNTAGDGCSPTCTLEVDESEPNDVLAMANPYSAPWVARLDPDNDVDVVSITVPAGATLSATTFDPTGAMGCSLNIDTYVEILAANGAVLAQNDDAAGNCSFVKKTNLPAGKYYVRVQAPLILGMSQIYLFPYGLALTVQ